MKLGILFSGGKDSTYACYLARRLGYDVSCLISIVSKNEESFMFHTPSISKVEKQAFVMDIPLVKFETSGKKEVELKDLEKAILYACKKYGVQGIVSGALESVYQATRVQRICNKLKIECFNPLWQKNQIELLDELLEKRFEVIITGVFAYPLDKSWIGRKIDLKFIEDVKEFSEKYKINPSGEGGEFETFVLDCLLFKKPLHVVGIEIHGKGNSWRGEVEVK